MGNERDNRLSDFGIFERVYFPPDPEEYHQEVAETHQRMFDSMLTSLGHMRDLKNNHPYRDFVSKKLGWDLGAAFTALEHVPLVTYCYPLENVPPESASAKTCLDTHTDNEKVHAILYINPPLFSEKNKTKGETTTRHEFGHLLRDSLRFIEPETKRFKIDPQTGQPLAFVTLPDWQGEVDADRIAVALDPAKERHALDFLEQKKPYEALLFNLYAADKIGPKTSILLANFCMYRDYLLTKAIHTSVHDNGAKWDTLHQMNDMFKMNCDPVYPSDLTRAAKADQFAGQCNKFLKTLQS